MCPWAIVHAEDFAEVLQCLVSHPFVVCFEDSGKNMAKQHRAERDKNYPVLCLGGMYKVSQINPKDLTLKACFNVDCMVPAN